MGANNVTTTRRVCRTLLDLITLALLLVIAAAIVYTGMLVFMFLRVMEAASW